MKKESNFNVKSGKLVISDPCYNKKTWCGNYDLPAQNGKWNCGVEKSDEGDLGSRVSILWAYHQSCDFSLDSSNWEKLPNEVGVDSGQAGIFCSSIYPKTKDVGNYGDLNTFYGKACNETCNDDGRQFGIVDNAGVCSSSGYGDGGYSGYCIKNKNNEIIAVKIIFIDNEEENEEDNENNNNEEDEE